MSSGILSDITQALKLAIFQRDEQGRLCLVGRAPAWLTTLWPQVAAPDGVLPPATSPFLENFLVDAAACWQAAGSHRVSSGLWVESDAGGQDHHLQATALVAAGHAVLLIEEPDLAYQERISMLQTAHEGALAYEKLQRAEQQLAAQKRLLEQQYRQQAALAEIELSINQPRDLQRVLNRVTEVLTQLLPATAASVVLWDAQSDQFTVSASTVPGQPFQQTTKRVRRREGATRWIIDHQQPCVVPDVARDPFGANSMLGEFQLRAYAGLPLIVDGKALGVIYALDDQAREYEPAGMDFLSALASRAALAISKVQFVEQLKAANRQLDRQAAELTEKNDQLAAAGEQLERRVQQRTAELCQANAALAEEIDLRRRYAERLQGIHEIDKAILAAHSPEAIAEAALRRLHPLLPCEHASVVVLAPEPEHASILASIQEGEITKGNGCRLLHSQLEQAQVLKSGKLQRITGAPNMFEIHSNDAKQRSPVWPLVVDVPLIAEDTLMGVLNLATRSPEAFTREHEEIAAEIADQLALAIRQARLFAQITAGREQLRALTLRLLEVQEAERRFMAHELHDEIGQLLTGLKLTLELPGHETAQPPGENVREAIAVVDELMNRVRQLSLDLRPQVLDDLGLMPALDWLFKRYFKQTGIRVHFKHACRPRRLPSQLETAAFRIVQEALTNIARHAGVQVANVRLWLDEDKLGVQIEDEGAGFDGEPALAGHASSGVAGMRERALMLGGEFTLDAKTGQGTRVTVEIPLVVRAAPATRNAGGVS